MSGEFRSAVRRVRLVQRAGAANLPRDIAVDDLRLNDHFEIVDAPVYEVDPVTQTCRTTLQVFRFTGGGGTWPIPSKS